MIGSSGEMPRKVGRDENALSKREKAGLSEARSARRLNGKLVAGSGSTPYSKGDYRTTNRHGASGKGFCYQQKTSVKHIGINQSLLDKTRFEAARHGMDPVLEIIIGNNEPWFAVPLSTWEILTGEGTDATGS